MVKDNAVQLDNVSVTYPNGFEAIRGINLAVSKGEILALLGPSGSGKSTVLRAVAGLEEVTAGRVLIDGADVAAVPVHKRGCGMVFQSPQLFPHRNVGRNVAFGIEKSGLTRDERTDRVNGLLDLVGLAGFSDRPITTLSGGQAQRVALARSLAPQPRILLLDEPLSALDTDLRRELADELRQILRRAAASAIYVTHDIGEADQVCDRTCRIDKGEIVR